MNRAILNTLINIAAAFSFGTAAGGPIGIVVFLLMITYVKYQVFIRSGSLIHRVPDTVAEMIGGMTARLQGEEPSRSSEAMFGYVRGATSGAWGVMTPKAPAQQIEQAAGPRTERGSGA